MKHRTVLVISALVALCLFVALVPSGLSATTWLTYREDVAIDSGTVDIAYSSYVNDTGTAGSYTNITLPCLVSSLTNDTTYINISTTSNQTYNMSVNGNSCNDTSILNTTYFVWNLTDLLSGSKIAATDTYVNVSFDFNESSVNNVSILITASDAPLLSTWLSSNVVVREKDVASSAPFIGTTPSRSWWVVNDSIATSNSIGYTLSDVNLTPTFSSQTITAPATYYNVGAIANGASTTTYAQYQKRGPYLYDIDDDSSGTSHDVTIYIQTNELLTSCVDWSIDISDAEYDDVFDDINYNTLDVELNGLDIDWDEGSVDMEDLTIKTSYSNNKFTFTWTEPSVIPPPVQPAWYMLMFIGLAVYLWITIIIAAIVIVALVLLIRKK